MRIFIFVLLVLPKSVWAATKVTLDESYLAATGKNELVLQGEEKIKQADERVSQVVGKVFPKIDFNVTHAIVDEPSDPVAKQFSPQQQTTASFSLTQPLFSGLREWRGLSLYKHLRTAEQASQEGRLQMLYKATADAYLRVLSLEQTLKNLDEQASIYEQRVKELSNRVRRGESNQTDAVMAESMQASVLAEIRLTQADLESARQRFALVTGLAADSELVDPNFHSVFKLQALDKYLERVPRRPDVRTARENYEAAAKGAQIAWGAHWPTADIVGNYYLKRPGFLSDIEWDVSLQVRVPIFEGFATQAKYREEVSKRKEAELEMERTKRHANEEITSLYRKVSARIDQLRNLRKAAELSRKNALLLQKDYRRGLARNIDVQVALTEYRSAQRTFDQAHFDSQLDLISLLTASGMAPIKPKGSHS